MKHNLPINLDSDGRIERPDLYLAIATLMSYRATCGRGKCGAIITRDNRIISTGYNGPLGTATCADLKCDLAKKCLYSVHAEANAIAAAAKHGISLEGATLYTSVRPCYNCSQLIVQAGIIKVIYANDYTTDTLGYSLFKQNNIASIHYHNG